MKSEKEFFFSKIYTTAGASRGSGATPIYKLYLPLPAQCDMFRSVPILTHCLIF
ncbi:hypothetical protein HanPSC8_Chr05g0194961 [Helianthus annuus]|nr:hypothetical protein HanPSC8_Chr05g0194961 [Helianthus annuus]